MMSRVGHYEAIPNGVLGSCCPNTEKLRHPDFFLIGASKCGTSSIARHFLAHPKIAFQSRTGGMMGEQDDLSTNIGKWDDMETHYYDVAAFSEEDIGARQIAYTPPGLDKEDLLGAYCPHNIFHPLAPFRLSCNISKEASTNMKFVIFLRNPVKRALSSFRFKVSTDSEERSMDATLMNGILRREKYERALRLRFGVPVDDETVKSICEAMQVVAAKKPKLEVDADEKKKFWEKVLRELYYDRTDLIENNFFLEHVGKGIYFEQIERWWALFPRRNFYITSLECFINDPVGEFSNLLRFIDPTLLTSEFDIVSTVARKFNVTPSSVQCTPSPHVTARLGEFYKPYDERLFQLIGRRLW